MRRSFSDRVAALLALCAALAPATLRAQTPDPGAVPTPEATVRAFIAALESQRWEEAARLVHPEALDRYRERSLSSLRAVAHRPSITAELFLRQDPQMPREVAEYQARRAAEGAREYPRFEFERAGVASVEELERLSPEQAFARYLEANDLQRSLQREIERETDEQSAELFTRDAPRLDRVVVGSVPAPQPPGGISGMPAGEFAYVLYSVAHRVRHYPKHGPERVAVMGVRRDGSGWKLDPGDYEAHELFGSSNYTVGFSHVEDGAPDLSAAVRQVVVWPDTGAPQLRIRLVGAGPDPLNVPPTALILERLAPDGTVAARVEVPADASGRLGEIVTLWCLLIPETEDP
ncbi:MAG: hypothetical protein ABW277_23000 [Longimicrobiaceae bacterium]